MGWLLNLSYFSGGSAILGQVDSTCLPRFDFLSQREVLVTTCTATGAGKLVAISTDGRHFWEALTSEATIWPLLLRAAGGPAQRQRNPDLRSPRSSAASGRRRSAAGPLSCIEQRPALENRVKWSAGEFA